MSRLDEIREAAKARLAAQNKSAGTTKTAPDEPKPEGIDKEPYEAFSAPTGDQQIRLIVYARQCYAMPRYDLLYDVFFEGRGEHIAFIFPHQRITFYGRNLHRLVAALRTNSVEWVKEFDPVIHADVTDKEAAFIDTIDIQTNGENPMSTGGGNG